MNFIKNLNIILIFIFNYQKKRLFLYIYKEIFIKIYKKLYNLNFFLKLLKDLVN